MASFEKTPDEFQPSSEKKLEIKDLNGCEVILEENKVIAGPEKEDAIAEILLGTINSPKLSIRKDGKPLSGAEFRAWRQKLFEDPEFISNRKYEKIFSALKQNTLSRTRMTQIESIITLLSDRPESADWKNRYDTIAKNIDGPAYSALSEEERTKLMEQVEDLGVEIYNAL